MTDLNSYSSDCFGRSRMWEQVNSADLCGTDASLQEVYRLRAARSQKVAAPLSGIVADSWKRCLSDYNLDPDRVPRAAVLTHSEMRELADRHHEMIGIAEPEVERLFTRLVDSEYLVSFASPEAVMMLFRCDYPFMDNMSGFGVQPGSVWVEERQGTNGVGTCLRTGRSIAIAGGEHYGSSTRALTCMTAPVFGRDGAIEGAINVTTASGSDMRANHVVRDIVERAALRIENRQFLRQHRTSRLLRIAVDVVDAELAEAGHVALDEKGCIRAGTSNLQALVGVSLAEVLGRRVEEAFDLGSDLDMIRPDETIRMHAYGRCLQALVREPVSDAPRWMARPGGRNPAQSEAISKVQMVDEVSEPRLSRMGPVSEIALERGQRLLQSGLPLIVVGETGTGKSAYARAVATRCLAREGEMIFVDCAAMAGDEAGRAIRSISQTRGSACLILDRIDELDDAGQIALLGMLERDRSAGANGISVVANTNLSLEQMQKDGRPRASLLHRLKGGSIVLPPLRAIADLEGMILEMLEVEAQILGKANIRLGDEARVVLLNYHWPGNARELQHALRHAAVLCDDRFIQLDHLPDDIVAEIADTDLTARSKSEASRIQAALRHNNGNVSLTARYLGVSRATLYRKINIGKVRVEAS
ncbi:sigma-54-dependent Fis family transcriptional regulator [Sinirhodobacter populi]|uniref:Sigma-54-dependent Fis family transcriptional regulator n=2 Tax=Paenirhodobacter populi TaxID=2306993 RepID=A0A443JR36_9RHOB|nr:sigma-54-dependent Fis family transcriptional regulator [Sinirhodobacter populi]